MSEFFVFPGCIFFMTWFEGILVQCKWWSSLPVNEFKGAPFWLGKYISLQNFEVIMQGLRYTNCPWPHCKDHIHDVREIIDTFNNTMKTIIILDGCHVFMSQ